MARRKNSKRFMDFLDKNGQGEYLENKTNLFILEKKKAINQIINHDVEEECEEESPELMNSKVIKKLFKKITTFKA
jgi:hypothetical protein